MSKAYQSQENKKREEILLNLGMASRNPYIGVDFNDREQVIEALMNINGLDKFQAETAADLHLREDMHKTVEVFNKVHAAKMEEARLEALEKAAPSTSSDVNESERVQRSPPPTPSGPAPEDMFASAPTDRIDNLILPELNEPNGFTEAALPPINMMVTS
jgi:hypothetical protein